MLTQVDRCPFTDAFSIATLSEKAMLKDEKWKVGVLPEQRRLLTTRLTGNVRPARPLRVDCFSLALLFADDTVVFARPDISRRWKDNYEMSPRRALPTRSFKESSHRPAGRREVTTKNEHVFSLSLSSSEIPRARFSFAFRVELNEWMKNSLHIAIEPDIHLSDDERMAFDACLGQFYRLCHVPMLLTCSLLSLGAPADRESTRLNHYLRIRQPRKFYWIRNIQQMFLHLRLPLETEESITASLIELHARKRVPHAARTVIEQTKPIRLIYSIDEGCLKINIRGENSLLQLFISAELPPASKGIYYKWTDEGHLRSTSLQFDIEYALI